MEKRIFGYDLVRAIAIILVMIGHSLGFIYSGNYSFFLSFFSGFFGVELFFVLSGILIGKLLINIFNQEDLEKNLKNFLFRRWFRTLPLYFLMLIIYYLGNRFLDPIPNHNVAFWKYLFFIQNFFKVQPTFFGISWSLSVEEWFYILFPLFLFLIKKSFPKTPTKKIFFSGILIFIIYFLMMRIFNLSDGGFTFYEGVRKVAFLRLDAIVFGVFSVWLMTFYKKQIFKNKNFLFLIGIFILIGNQYLIFKDHYQNLAYFNSFYFTVLGIGLCYLFPVFKSLKFSENTINKGITYISKISYSLYLVHWIIFKIVEMNFFSNLNSNLKFSFFFLFSFISAAILHHFFEKPILKYRDKITPK